MFKNDLFNDYLFKKLDNCIDFFVLKISNYRTNNVSVDMISNIVVDYYGKKTKLNYLSRIWVSGSLTLKLSVFDKSIKNSIRKCIEKSNFSLTTNLDRDGDIIVNLPPITNDHKIKVIKLIKKDLEIFRIKIRNIRKEFLIKLNDLEKKSTISKDQLLFFKKKTQIIIEKYIIKLSNIFDLKIKKIL